MPSSPEMRFLTECHHPWALIACCIAACQGEVGALRARGAGTASSDSAATNPVDDGAGFGTGDASGLEPSSNTGPGTGDTEPTGDAGPVATTHDASEPNPEHPPGAAPLFVAVGYAGRRLRSLDLGKTWTDDVELGGGGDDGFLLRSVTFHDGLFVAAGYKILTSPNGAAGSWTEQKNPRSQWIGGLRWGNGRFVGVGGYGTSWVSVDGKAWRVAGVLGEEPSRALVFGQGVFTSWTEPGHHFWTSTDGEAWTQLPGDHPRDVAVCGGQTRDRGACTGAYQARGIASGGGTTVRINGEGRLERSDDGVAFTRVVSDGPELQDVAVGWL